jgi:hypothetical protein
LKGVGVGGVVTYGVLVRKLRTRQQDLGIDERLILQWVSQKQDVRAWTGFIWLRIRTGGRIL